MINTNRIAIANKIAELTRECMLLNDDDFTVFVNVSGHIQSVSIRAYVGGWRKNMDASFDNYYCFETVNVQTIIDTLKALKADSDKIKLAERQAEKERLIARLKELDNE
ncbi:hypothetical protein TW1_061 [Pseudoalteromonas phage TW1]|uniref:hypothetical protein n=1 Tax=Pseudoalteromonas phage TW1 TaxID=1366055 RepID=UPI00035AADA9|nr:hypothetical protein PP585_gp61 [Pseudoalteromonas phage TW1]AGR46577.1 hypothetical protein TW1_061 [Pseudoalteromonas phage TW1]